MKNKILTHYYNSVILYIYMHKTLEYYHYINLCNLESDKHTLYVFFTLNKIYHKL